MRTLGPRFCSKRLPSYYVGKPHPIFTGYNNTSTIVEFQVANGSQLAKFVLLGLPTCFVRNLLRWAVLRLGFVAVS